MNETITKHPIGPSAFDALMHKLDCMHYDMVRLETRLCKLIVALGHPEILTKDEGEQK